MKATVIFSQGDPASPTHLEVELRPDEGDDALDKNLLNLPDGAYAIRRFESNGVKGWRIGSVKSSETSSDGIAGALERQGLVTLDSQGHVAGVQAPTYPTFLEKLISDMFPGETVSPLPLPAPKMTEADDVATLRAKLDLYERVYSKQATEAVDDLRAMAAVDIGTVKAEDIAARFEALVAALGPHGPAFRITMTETIAKAVDLFVEERKKKLARKRAVRKVRPNKRATRKAVRR